MTNADYFAIGARFKRGEAGYVMSQSSLKLFASDPKSWIEGREVEETKSMEWGNLLDVLYLQPEKFDESYTLYPRMYPSPVKPDPHRMKPWDMKAHYCQQWAEEKKKAGIFPISRRVFDGCKMALQKLREHEVARLLRDECQTQVVCQWEWTDPVTKITLQLKCMIDIAPDDAPYLADLKSSVDASLSGFRKMASRFRYDVQGAFYKWGYQECYRDTQEFALIVSESKHPYPVATYRLTPNDFQVGRYGGKDRWGSRMGFQDMLTLYCRCLDTGKFPELNNGDLVPLNLYRD